MSSAIQYMPQMQYFPPYKDGQFELIIQHMIQRIPISNQVFNSKVNSFIWFQSHHTVSLTEALHQLYESTSQRDRSIYGVKIYKPAPSVPALEQQHKQRKQSGQLWKVELEGKTKQYLTWCYLILNWEYLSIPNLDMFINSLPNSEQQIDEIRIEGTFMKMSKSDKALVLDLRDMNMKIEDNKYYLDSFDREGRSDMLQYSRSLCKISIGPVGYRFDGLIRIVESCEGFVAVTTSESVYIISLKLNSGKCSKFNLPECIDVKWGRRGLYYLQRDGTLGLLQRQTTFIPKLNEFSQHTTLQLSNYIGKEYLPHRLAVSGHDEVNTSVVIMAVSSNNPRKMLLQVVDSAKHGMYNDSTLSIELKEVTGEIMYKNLLYIKGALKLIVANGTNGNIQRYHQYRFGAV